MDELIPPIQAAPTPPVKPVQMPHKSFYSKHKVPIRWGAAVTVMLAALAIYLNAGYLFKGQLVNGTVNKPSQQGQILPCSTDTVTGLPVTIYNDRPFYCMTFIPDGSGQTATNDPQGQNVTGQTINLISLADGASNSVKFEIYQRTPAPSQPVNTVSETQPAQTENQATPEIIQQNTPSAIHAKIPVNAIDSNAEGSPRDANLSPDSIPVPTVTTGAIPLAFNLGSIAHAQASQTFDTSPHQGEGESSVQTLPITCSPDSTNSTTGVDAFICTADATALGAGESGTVYFNFWSHEATVEVVVTKATAAPAPNPGPVPFCNVSTLPATPFAQAVSIERDQASTDNQVIDLNPGVSYDSRFNYTVTASVDGQDNAALDEAVDAAITNNSVLVASSAAVASGAAPANNLTFHSGDLMTLLLQSKDPVISGLVKSANAIIITFNASCPRHLSELFPADHAISLIPKAYADDENESVAIGTVTVNFTNPLAAPVTTTTPSNLNFPTFPDQKFDLPSGTFVPTALPQTIDLSGPLPTGPGIARSYSFVVTVDGVVSPQLSSLLTNTTADPVGLKADEASLQSSSAANATQQTGNPQIHVPDGPTLIQIINNDNTYFPTADAKTAIINELNSAKNIKIEVDAAIKTNLSGEDNSIPLNSDTQDSSNTTMLPKQPVSPVSLKSVVPANPATVSFKQPAGSLMMAFVPAAHAADPATLGTFEFVMESTATTPAAPTAPVTGGGGTTSGGGSAPVSSGGGGGAVFPAAPAAGGSVLPLQSSAAGSVGMTQCQNEKNAWVNGSDQAYKTDYAKANQNFPGVLTVDTLCPGNPFLRIYGALTVYRINNYLYAQSQKQNGSSGVGFKVSRLTGNSLLQKFTDSAELNKLSQDVLADVFTDLKYNTLRGRIDPDTYGTSQRVSLDPMDYFSLPELYSMFLQQVEATMSGSANQTVTFPIIDKFLPNFLKGYKQNPKLTWAAQAWTYGKITGMCYPTDATSGSFFLHTLDRAEVANCFATANPQTMEQLFLLTPAQILQTYGY